MVYFLIGFCLFDFKNLTNLSFKSYFNDAKVENLNIEGNQNKKLIKIDSVNESHSGLYKVIATNNVGNDEAVWNVIVEGIFK